MTHFEIICSPLSQPILVEGNRFEVHIYRGEDTLWTLEVVNAMGTSFIWDELFPTDEDALCAALADFEASPVKNFLS